MGRSPCCDKSAVKRGPWSAEEDARLRSYMERHGGGGGSWLALPRKAGLRRCGKSCRLRWLNYLRPGLRRGGFTPEEDTVICALYAAVGSRWSFIAAHLPGRTDNGVKNYWNTRLKKKLFAGGGRRRGYRHDEATNAGNVDDAAPLLPLPPPPCWSSQPYAYGAMGCAGDVGDHMHVGAGGVFTGMIASTNEAAAVHQSASTCYSSEPAATELDEIFRSTGPSGGEHSDLSRSSNKDMEALNWNHHIQQGESVLQNHLGVP